MVQFCGKAVTSLRAMTEGGRRVLLVAAKTTPLMIRDAMTGGWLEGGSGDGGVEYTYISEGTVIGEWRGGGHREEWGWE